MSRRRRTRPGQPGGRPRNPRENFRDSPAPELIKVAHDAADTAQDSADAAQGDANDAKGDISTIKQPGWVTRARIGNKQVGPDEIDDNAGTTRVIAPGSSHKDHFPVMEGVGRVLPGGAAPNGDVPVLVRNENITAVGGAKVSNINDVPGQLAAAGILDGAIGSAKISNLLNNPGQGTYGLRTIGGTGSAVAAAASNHSHSLSFKLLARPLRRAVLKVRERIRTGGRERELEERVRDLEQMVLVLCHLAFDDEDYDAHDRERLLTESSEAGRVFRRRYLKERRHDLGHGMQLESKGGFYREPHPDMPEPSEAEISSERPRTSAHPRPLPGKRR